MKNFILIFLILGTYVSLDAQIIENSFWVSLNGKYMTHNGINNEPEVSYFGSVLYFAPNKQMYLLRGIFIIKKGENGYILDYMKSDESMGLDYGRWEIDKSQITLCYKGVRSKYMYPVSKKVLANMRKEHLAKGYFKENKLILNFKRETRTFFHESVYGVEVCQDAIKYFYEKDNAFANMDDHAFFLKA